MKPNPHQPPPPPPCVDSVVNPAYRIPLPKKPMQTQYFSISADCLNKIDRYTYDRATSERLVLQVAHNNPSRDGQWCAEKALWDLERDRH